MGRHVWMGRPCLQRLLGAEGLKQYTTAASTLLRSAGPGALALRAASQDFFLNLFDFLGEKRPKRKMY